MFKRAVIKVKNKLYLIGLSMLLSIPVVSIAAPLPASITLNMKGADITAFVGTVAKQTGKNFIIDPRVKGKVTLISHKPLSKRALYQVFLSVLEVHGFTAVPGGAGTVKIVPVAEAKHSGIPAVDGTQKLGDEAVTQVIEVRHVPAAQLVPILRPLVPPQGHLAAYPPSNVLIISDRANNIRRLLSIIERIDQKTSDEVEVITLEHASAGEVVRILNSLSKKQNVKDAAGAPTIVADERTNSVLLGGDPSARLRLRTIITHLDTPLDSGGNIHVVYLRYANAKDLVPVLTGVGKDVAQGAASPGGKAKRRVPRRSTGGNNNEFSIQADESTNSLVISAPPGIMRSLQAVIKKLDVRRAQVLVEAIIAEVNLNREADLGVQWIVADRDGDRPAIPGAATNFGLVDVTTVANGGPGALAALPSGFTLGVGRIGKGVLNFGAIVTALKGDANSNILSTPSLVTLDNVEAEINVGEEVPFLTGSFTSTGGGSTPTNPFQTIQRKNVGLSLKVKPQINEGNTIRLDIDQKIDSLGTGTTGAVDLITNTRSIKTSILVNDGQTIVLGGLIKEDLQESVSKVPLLGDIPLLGNLFRKRGTKKTKTNLMVFLRPNILRNAKDTQSISSEKYNFFRAKQMEQRKKGVGLMRDKEVPVLPELKEIEESLLDKTSSVGQDDLGGADDF